MPDANAARFTGSIPVFYDQQLGPIIFSEYAENLAHRVALFSPQRVLETAAGTGILTRLLRDHLDESSRITATDLNPPMLAVAKAKFRPSETVTFAAADATDLPFTAGAFDAVVCQFGVMFYPDKVKSYREVRRVLVQGGRYLFNVWDSHAHNPFGRVAYETVCGFFPADPPQFHRVPFAYHDIDEIKESLIAADFHDIRIAVVGIAKKVPDVAAFARGLIQGTPIVDQISARCTVPAERVVDTLENSLRSLLGAADQKLQMQAIIFDAA